MVFVEGPGHGPLFLQTTGRLTVRRGEGGGGVWTELVKIPNQNWGREQFSKAFNHWINYLATFTVWNNVLDPKATGF